MLVEKDLLGISRSSISLGFLKVNALAFCFSHNAFISEMLAGGGHEELVPQLLAGGGGHVDGGADGAAQHPGHGGAEVYHFLESSGDLASNLKTYRKTQSCFVLLCKQDADSTGQLP